MRYSCLVIYNVQSALKPLLPLEKYACHDPITGKTTRTHAYSQRAKALSSLSSDSDRTHDARHDAYPRTSRRISYWNLAYALTEPNRQ